MKGSLVPSDAYQIRKHNISSSSSGCHHFAGLAPLVFIFPPVPLFPQPFPCPNSSPSLFFAHRLAARRATPSDGAVLVDLADGLETLAGDPEGLVDDALGHGEAQSFTRGAVGAGGTIDLFGVAFCAAAIGVVRGGSVAVGGDGGAGAGFCAAADVVEDTAEEVRVRGNFAGAEEGEGVGADGGGPVGVVGVEGVEEGVLDPGGRLSLC